MSQFEPAIPLQSAQVGLQNESANASLDFKPALVQVPRSRDASAQAESKQASPFSQPSSVTPPPSTQNQHHPQTVTRTPSPIGLLNSPPPTAKQEVQHVPPTNGYPTQGSIDHASIENLRMLLHKTSAELHEARTTSAHYKLQYNMLVIDSNKAKNEMDVELTMLQRELDLLQEAEDRRRATSTPLQSIEASNLATIHELTRQVDALALDNESLKVALSQERKINETRDVRIASLEEQNTNLRQRIRQNREHMNGILDNVLERSPQSALGTPSRNSYYGTPRRTIMSTPGRQIERRDNLAFDALLLADKVLSQETATAPSTPKNMGRHGRAGHVRNTHSLSSLPAAPHRRMQPAQNVRNPLQLASILEPVSLPTSAPQPRHADSASYRRRASSDTTITASDDERPKNQGISTQSQPQAPYDSVPESSASQAATSMLRATPNKPKKQSKIVGKVTKPSVSQAIDTSSTYLTSPEKRRNTSGLPIDVERALGDDGSPKKRRVGTVGLGIGI